MHLAANGTAHGIDPIFLQTIDRVANTMLIAIDAVLILILAIAHNDCSSVEFLGLHGLLLPLGAQASSFVEATYTDIRAAVSLSRGVSLGRPTPTAQATPIILHIGRQCQAADAESCAPARDIDSVSQADGSSLFVDSHRGYLQISCESSLRWASWKNRPMRFRSSGGIRKMASGCVRTNAKSDSAAYWGSRSQ